MTEIIEYTNNTQTRMQASQLIKAILRHLKDTWKEVAPQRAAYAAAAVSYINRVNKVQTKVNVTGLELAQLVTKRPRSLKKQEEEGYAYFIRELLTVGHCYGMVQEDPLGANTLLESALSILRRLIVEKRRLYLFPSALDLMLLQGMARINLGETELARRQLLAIIDLTADTFQQDEQTDPILAGIDAAYFMNDVLLRAAPAAILLKDIYKTVNSDKLANASLMLATTLYKELKEKRVYDIYGSTEDYIAVLMALSELSLYQGNTYECVELLDTAIEYIDIHDKDIEDGSGSCQYVSSVVHQRRAEIFAIVKEWEDALKHYTTALSFAKMALKSSQLNTHYQDHYATLLNEMGIMHGVRGNLPLAQNTFLEAIDARKQLVSVSSQYAAGLVACLSNMSTLMRTFNNNEVALVYLKDAIAESARANEPVDKALTESMQSLLEKMESKPLFWYRRIHNSREIGPN